MTNFKDKILVMAESDVKFDGYDSLDCLSRERRERYINRAERSFYALQQYNHEQLKKLFSIRDSEYNK